MRCQVLSSGSGGNATLVRVGDTCVLVDSGLPPRAMRARLADARLSHKAIGHVLITHAHLDHCRSAGVIAKSHDATLHCAERMMRNRSVNRAPRFETLRIGGEGAIPAPPPDLFGEPSGRLSYRPVLLPHDCDPTVAFRLEYGGRVVVILTDMGRPVDAVARKLADAHVLVLEFNHDAALLRDGPYADSLKRRVAGERGHLSNDEAAWMLERMAGPELHTLVLAHLSETNNTPELAQRSAQAALERIGRGDVRVLIADQHEVGPNLEV